MDSYIKTQINILEEERELLNQKLLDLAREEAALKEQLQTLAEEQDIDMEVFSPRYPNTDLKQKISEIKEKLEELQFQQMQYQAKIELSVQKIQKYHEVLLETKTSETYSDRQETKEQASGKQEESEELTRKPDQGYPDDQSHREHYEDILKRIEKCLNYLYSDRQKCKTELKGIRYLLRALLAQEDSKKQTDNR